MSVTRPFRVPEGSERLPRDAAASGAQRARSLASSAQASLARRPRWWVELGVIVWLCWVYDAITNLAPLRRDVALAHAASILRLERSLHLDPELTLNRWLSHHHTLGLLVSDYYDNAHFLVTLGLLGWLWWRRADLYRPLRNMLVLINVIGFAVFWRYPVAPPRMLSGAGFVDVVAHTHAFGSWHTGALASEANQLAAMPSLHLAWAAWCALVVWRMSSRRWVRALGLLYPLLTTFAVLSTGNHFLADVVAGVATAAVAYLVVWAADAARRVRDTPGVGRRWPRGRRERMPIAVARSAPTPVPGPLAAPGRASAFAGVPDSPAAPSSERSTAGAPGTAPVR